MTREVMTPEALSRSSVDALRSQHQLIAQAVGFLAAALPPGSSYLFSVVDGAPKLVSANGQPATSVGELVLITRPLAYIQQEIKVQNKPAVGA